MEPALAMVSDASLSMAASCPRRGIDMELGAEAAWQGGSALWNATVQYRIDLRWTFTPNISRLFGKSVSALRACRHTGAAGKLVGHGLCRRFGAAHLGQVVQPAAH